LFPEHSFSVISDLNLQILDPSSPQLPSPLPSTTELHHNNRNQPPNDVTMSTHPNEEEIPSAENPQVRELLDIILKEASRIAAKSSELSAEELMRAAGFYVLGEVPRLQSRKPNAWNLFLRMEKENVPEELRTQTDGVAYKQSRPGLSGEYSSYMKKRWESEPETRKKYERMAKGTAASSVEKGVGSSARNSQDGDPDPESDQERVDVDTMLAAAEARDVEVELKSLKEVQKKSMKNLRLFVSIYSHVLLCTYLKLSDFNSSIFFNVSRFTLSVLLFLARWLIWSCLRHGGKLSSIGPYCVSKVEATETLR
jgi:hypothetical protein